MKLSFLLFLLMLALLLIFPQRAAEAGAQGLRLCGTVLIPGLFPYLLATRLVLSSCPPMPRKKWADRLMGRLFGVSGRVLPVFLLSFAGGYPLGAALLCTRFREGAIRKEELRRALRFCNNSGPGFFLAVAGLRVLGDVSGGLVLFGIHVLSAVLTGLLLAEPPLLYRLTPLPEGSPRKPPGSLFLDSVTDTCQALLGICGLVLSFRVLLGLIPVSCPLAGGLLELSSGVLGLRDGVPASLVFPLCAFFTGWGGLCVQLQAASFLGPLGLRFTRELFLGKLLHGILSLFLALLWQYPRPYFLLPALGLLVCALLLPVFRKNPTGKIRSFQV